MTTGKSGYIFAHGQNVDTRFLWEEVYNPLTNLSEPAIVGADVRTSGWRGNYQFGGDIKADESPWAQFGKLFRYIASADGVTWQPLEAMDVPFPWKISIPHEADGSKTVSVSINMTLNVWNTASIAVTGSTAITLTHIPRASGVGATDADIESTSIIAVSRKSDAYTHTIAYQFGSLSGYISADGSCVSSAQKLTATSIPWTVPASFYTQIPNAKNSICTLFCTTYSGDTQIADPQQAQITCTAAESRCAPELIASVRDGNETTVKLTGNADTLVRYFSAAVCTMQATARNGASIVSNTIAGADAPDGRRTINNVETGSITFVTTDSRGYSAALTVDKALVPYNRLTCKAVATRDDPTSGRATLHLSGTGFSASFGAVYNAITAKYCIGSGEYSDVQLLWDSNQYTAAVQLSGLDYRQSFTLNIIVKDKLMEVQTKATLAQGIPLLDAGENDISVNRLLQIKAGMTINGKSWLDYEHPVGSWYWSDDPTSPAEMWGGKWLQHTDITLVAAGGAFAVGTSGGEATHKMTKAEMPEHVHEGLQATSDWSKIWSVPGNANPGSGDYWWLINKDSYSGSKSAVQTMPAGGSQPLSLMQPYYASYGWQRMPDDWRG